MFTEDLNYGAAVQLGLRVMSFSAGPQEYWFSQVVLQGSVRQKSHQWRHHLCLTVVTTGKRTHRCFHRLISFLKTKPELNLKRESATHSQCMKPFVQNAYFYSCVIERMFTLGSWWSWICTPCVSSRELWSWKTASYHFNAKTKSEMTETHLASLQDHMFSDDDQI